MQEAARDGGLTFRFHRRTTCRLWICFILYSDNNNSYIQLSIVDTITSVLNPKRSGF